MGQVIDHVMKLTLKWSLFILKEWMHPLLCHYGQRLSLGGWMHKNSKNTWEFYWNVTKKSFNETFILCHQKLSFKSKFPIDSNFRNVLKTNFAIMTTKVIRTMRLKWTLYFVSHFQSLMFNVVAHWQLKAPTWHPAVFTLHTVFW